MYALFEAAKSAGARGAALSGAGPTIIAFADHQGEPVARAMAQAARRIRLAGTTYVVKASAQGAQVRRVA
jgi:homoserine kinase